MAGKRTQPAVGRPAPPASMFLRGLTVGALVGAAVAGSVLFGRGRRRAIPADDRGAADQPAAGGSPPPSGEG